MKNILIIDDDDLQLYYLIAVFKKYFPKIEVHAVSTLAAGIKALNNEEYALLILDLILPDAQVLNVLTEINTENKVPILVMSSKNELTSSEQLYLNLMDMTDFVTKEIPTEDLVKIISSKIMEYNENAFST